MLTLFLLLAGGAENQPLGLSESLAAAPVSVQAPAEDAGKSKWTGSVTLGAKVTTGNSESRGGNAGADAVLRRTDDRFTLGIQWLFDQNKNNPANTWVLTDRKTTGSGQYDYFFSEKTYGLAQAALVNDLNAGLDLRQTYGLGVGHQFREDEKLTLGAEAGVAFVDETYKVATNDKEYTAARVAYKLSYVISESMNLGHNVEAFPSLENSTNIYLRADTRLKAALGGSMFGQLQWLYDWNNNPALGADRVDQQFLLSIGWKI